MADYSHTSFRLTTRLRSWDPSIKPNIEEFGTGWIMEQSLVQLNPIGCMTFENTNAMVGRKIGLEWNSVYFHSQFNTEIAL